MKAQVPPVGAAAILRWKLEAAAAGRPAQVDGEEAV